MNTRLIENNVGECENLKQLCMKTGIGSKKLRNEFSKHPMLKRRIENQLNLGSDVKENELIFPTFPCIVLDCSVVSSNNLIEAIDAYINIGYKFVITSITNKELDRRQEYSKFKDFNSREYNSGRNSRKLLRKAVLEEENFICIEIPEKSLNPDDDIINALRGRENLILWTGDKSMILSCRMANIPNMFIDGEIPLPEQTEAFEEELKEEPQQVEESEYSLYGLRYQDGELYMGLLNPYTTYIELYNQYGKRKMLTEALEVGDKILRIKKKSVRRCIYISEEKVLRISPTNNAKLIYNKKYFIPKEVKDIPIEYQEVYKRSKF